jgi:hypothetical protein
MSPSIAEVTPMVSNYQCIASHDSSSELKSSNGVDDGESTPDLGTTTPKSNKDVEDSPEAIVRVENKAITWVRVLVLLVLLLAASATVTFVYIFTHNSETDTFASEYDAVASTLAKSLLLDMRLSFWLARTLASTVTLALETTGQPSTNMTISTARWNAITQQALFVTDVAAASWIPFLYDDDDRRTFEAYVRESTEDRVVNPPCYLCGSNQDLVFDNRDDKVDVPGIGVYTCGVLYDGARDGGVPENSCQLVKDIVEGICHCVEQSSSDSRPESIYQGPSNETVRWTADKGLFRLSGEDESPVAVSQEYGTAPYAPMFVINGGNPAPVLYNQLSNPARAKALGVLMFGRTPTVSEMRVRSNAYDRYAFGSYLEGEPTSDLYFPVFGPDPIDPQLVGSVALELRWPQILSGGVPANADLLAVVIRNSCGQAYTYLIDQIERSLEFQGEGDLHDSKYDDWVRSTTYDEFQQLLGVVSNGISTSNTTDPSHCLYRFEVYPTQAMEDTYVTNEPAVFAVVSAVIFLFTSLVFVAYDMIVRRRQAKVMASAKRTNEIVSSLFPESVRQRMYNQASSADALPESLLRKSIMNPRKNHGTGQNDDNIFGTEPIADLFPHATVMFIDIAGFTAWSSEREPCQVFTLLENLYHAFDEVGRKLGIFKVETIGDSYVAVAGLPTPRKDHAVGTCLLCTIMYNCFFIINLTGCNYILLSI